MAYDEGLAEILRADLADRENVEEKRMFGGLCFMVQGHMLCGVHSGGGMFRVGKPREGAALAIEGVSELAFTGRKMGGLVDVTEGVLGDDQRRGQLMALAMENDVGIGAHPGFPDLQGFGRRQMQVPLPTLANMVRYQVGSAQAMAQAAGGEVRHLKLHGAMSNMACKDAEMARACYEAALDVAPDIIIMGLAATQMETVARDLGCNWAGEIFADRAYNADGTLVDRRLPGAMIHDGEDAAARMVEMVRAGAIITGDGARLDTRIDTICIHGDSASAVAFSGKVRKGLETAGIAIAKFTGAALT